MYEYVKEGRERETDRHTETERDGNEVIFLCCSITALPIIAKVS